MNKKVMTLPTIDNEDDDKDRKDCIIITSRSCIYLIFISFVLITIKKRKNIFNCKLNTK